MQKQKVAKTFSGCATRGFILFGYFATLRFAQYDNRVNFLDSWQSHDNRSNGGSALRRFYVKQAK